MNDVRKAGAMSSGSICFGNALYKVPDLQAAKQFYSKAFAVPTYFDEPDWVVFEVGGYELWLVPTDSAEEHPEAYWIRGKSHRKLTYWSVNDLNEVYQRFIDLGGRVRGSLRREGPFIWTIVEDPWGNTIGLHNGPSGAR